MAKDRIEIKFNHLPILRDKSPQQIDKMVRAAALEGRNRVVLDIQTPSPGRLQTRYNPTRQVTAAYEGHSPNTDTGTLVNSIQVLPDGFQRRKIIAGAEYSARLEFGTAGQGPRPFMTPMAQQLEADLPDFFQDLFKGMI